jgi:hypothetical protein
MPNIPEVIRNIPEVISNIPGDIRNIPGVISNIPRVISNIPEVIRNIPGDMPDIPGVIRNTSGDRKCLDIVYTARYSLAVRLIDNRRLMLGIVEMKMILPMPFMVRAIRNTIEAVYKTNESAGARGRDALLALPFDPDLCIGRPITRAYIKDLIHTGYSRACARIRLVQPRMNRNKMAFSAGFQWGYDEALVHEKVTVSIHGIKELKHEKWNEHILYPKGQYPQYEYS